MGVGVRHLLFAGSTHWLLLVISPFLDISLGLPQFRTEAFVWMSTCWVPTLFQGHHWVQIWTLGILRPDSPGPSVIRELVFSPSCTDIKKKKKRQEQQLEERMTRVNLVGRE